MGILYIAAIYIVNSFIILQAQMEICVFAIFSVVKISLSRVN